MIQNRREKILNGIDFKNLLGLEIGPLNRPIVKKEEGRILFVDYTTHEKLLEIHKVDVNIPQNAICPPDIIWGGKPLKECVGYQVDYIIASHVIEHVPDMVGWFKEIFETLKPGGILTLAIPDKRFTFDILRPTSTLGDVMQAYIEKSKRPSIRHVWDAITTTVKVSPQEIWLDHFRYNELKYYNTREDALFALDSMEKDDKYYHDCHCWVLTPESFLKILKSLSEMKLFDFSIQSINQTMGGDEEFFMTLEKPLSKSSQIQCVDYWISIVEKESKKIKIDFKKKIYLRKFLNKKEKIKRKILNKFKF